jgi:hypothetical protein
LVYFGDHFRVGGGLRGNYAWDFLSQEEKKARTYAQRMGEIFLECAQEPVASVDLGGVFPLAVAVMPPLVYFLFLTVMPFGLLCGLDRLVYRKWFVLWKRNLLLVLITQIIVQLVAHLLLRPHTYP